MKLAEFKEFAKRVPHYNIERLRKLAEENKFDVSKATSIDETRAAMIDAAEASLSVEDRETLQKERLAQMESEDKARERSKPDLDETSKTVLRVHQDFCREVPQELRNGGDVPEGHPRFGGEYRVADGTYRVVGSEFLFAFKRQRLVSVSHATPANKFGGDKVIAVNG